MKQFTLIPLAVAAVLLVTAGASARDMGKQDILRLCDARLEGDEWKIAVCVINDQELAALDIPLRFGRAGDPIELLRVEFADRVAGWPIRRSPFLPSSKLSSISTVHARSRRRTDSCCWANEALLGRGNRQRS